MMDEGRSHGLLTGGQKEVPPSKYDFYLSVIYYLLLAQSWLYQILYKLS